MFMKRIFFGAFCLLLLAGCITHQGSYKEKNELALKQMKTMPLPRWMYQRPTGNYVIGLSHKTKNPAAMQDAAKQSAAVNLSRNTDAIAIVNTATANSSQMLSSGSVHFNLVVSASPQLLKQKFTALNLVDECTYYENYIGLYSTTATSVGEQWTAETTQPRPSWADDLGLKLTDTQVISRAFGRSSDMILAWDKAMDAARQNIAQYLEKEVMGGVISTGTKVEKKISVETRIRVGKMCVSRSHVEAQIANSLLSYFVYVEVVMDRK